MESDQVLGLIAVGWLITAILLAASLIRKGRKLAKALATQHPELYEALGRPQPGYLQSDRRSRFSQFIANREYENLDDPALSAQFEDYQKAEARLLKSLLVSLGVLALLILTVRHVA